MKKISIPFLGALVILASCAKQDRIENLPSENITEEISGRRCAAEEVLQRQIAEDPSRAARLEQLEAFTQTYENTAGRNPGTLYVPVVVHVVMPNPNLVSDAQIQSQIAVLNKDFNKTNTELSNTSVYLAGYPHGNVADCDIQFVLVQTIRKASSTATFGTNDAVKKNTAGGSSPVNPESKLNLWVCDLSSGLLGYAQFPGGPVSTDGVVIDYQAFGTTASYAMYTQFKLGRTATHEVGHWFNLRHIWGDARCGNDQVSDTPLHDGSNGGCPTTSHRSKCSGKPLEQWMNYMDYTNDACMYMFTAGQKTRMDAAIDGSRSAYVSTTSPL